MSRGTQPASAHAKGVRTDPDEAAAFVAATGVDALAVAVGSSHAMTDRSAQLDRELIARITAATPVPLVLHGSSGVSDEQLRAAVAAGMRKINVGSALNIAFTGAVRHPGEPGVTRPAQVPRAGPRGDDGHGAAPADARRLSRASGCPAGFSRPGAR